MNQLGNWFNSPHRMTCLICAVFFALGAGWLAGISVGVDYIKEGNLGLGIIGIIISVCSLGIGLFGANLALMLIKSVESTYYKAEADKQAADTSHKQKPVNHTENRTNYCEDYSKQKQDKNLPHVRRVYRLLKRLSTKRKRYLIPCAVVYVICCVILYFVLR